MIFLTPDFRNEGLNNASGAAAPKTTTTVATNPAAISWPAI
jgi:hypothetical protein